MYFEKIVDNNIIYSVDMIRLKTYITYEQFCKLEFCINVSYKNDVKKMWFSDRPMCFHYNYAIEFEEGRGFYFGFLSNSEKIKFDKVDDKYNFTIEFNPNKVKEFPLLLRILNMSGDWYLKSLDLACDLKINILDIITTLSGKRTQKIISNGFDNKTIYIGSGNKRVKIYNKKRESNLNIQGNLTRVEVSIEFDDFRLLNIKLFKLPENLFPLLFLNDYLYSFETYEDKTLMAILFAVQSGYPVDDLSRVYKNKIKTLFNAGHHIRFSRKVADEVIRRVVFHYFMPNELVHWK